MSSWLGGLPGSKEQPLHPWGEALCEEGLLLSEQGGRWAAQDGAGEGPGGSACGWWGPSCAGLRTDGSCQDMGRGQMLVSSWLGLPGEGAEQGVGQQ